MQFVRSSGVQMLLIGNKCDLSSVRAVSSVEAEKVSTCDIHNYMIIHCIIRK